MCFLGGEPLLPKNINYISEIIAEVRNLNKKVSVHLVTNGINISKYIDYIVFWKPESLQITLDGVEWIQNTRRRTRNNTNGFYEIVKGIQALINANIYIELRCNIDSNNISYIHEYGRYIIENQWDSGGVSCYLYPVTDSSNPKYKVTLSETEIFHELLLTLKDEPTEIKKLFHLNFHGINYVENILSGQMPSIRTKFCGISKGQYVFMVDGRIFNCWWGITSNVFEIGHVIPEHAAIDVKKISEFHKRSTTAINRCKECKYKYICGGGCAYKEYSNWGTTDKGNCAEFDTLIGDYLNYAL